MPDPARRNLSILNEVYDKIKSKYDSEKTGISFVRWVSDYLLMNLEKDEFIRSYAPHLSKIGIHENRLIIKDTKKNQLAEIFLKDGQLYCSLDESTDCLHIHFALALPELARLKKNNK
jgi:hypothetical protein